MNKKYLNFSIILIVLSVFDIITTQYALSTYPHLSEGNPIMALVTSSFALFVLVKAVGIIFIVNIYKRIKAQSEIVSKIGQTAILMMMLFVVGNNIIQIASATTTYGVYTPNTLEYPGRVESGGSLSYAFILVNGTTIKEFGTTASTIPDIWDNGFSNAYHTRMTGTTFVFAVQDWAHPYRLFGVASNKDVFYTDTITTIDWSAGYYNAGILGCAVDGNCNDLHKIGVLTSLNTRMNGFVDSNGDLFISDGVSIVKFGRTSDYTKTTYLTMVAGTDYTATTCAFCSSLYDQITSIKLDSNNYMHISTGGSGTISAGGSNQPVHAYINHVVFSGTTRLFKEVLQDNSYTLDAYGSGASLNNAILINSNTSNTTKNIIIGYLYNSVVYLKYWNGSALVDICPISCGTITGFNGLQILGGYAYIASSAENKIYRFPTTIRASSGSGYTVGVISGATSAANIIYNTASITSLYSNYYNTTPFLISGNLDMDSGFAVAPLGDNYLVNLANYRWELNLIDPLGVVVNTKSSDRCTDAWTPFNWVGTCSLKFIYQFNAPSAGWTAGDWQVKLYEADITNYTHRALIATSSTWNVYNASVSANGSIIGSPSETITSGTSPTAITQIDGYVGLLGFGINGVSKFLFVLIITIIMFIVGMYYGKSGLIGLALSSLPYTFFAYISYVPKWSFIIYIIMLIVISKVFR